MENAIQSISLNKLIAHPDNPNRMSEANFIKLVRNIKRTGRYEPLVVRRHPEQRDCFQIINGHHRCGALRKLGYIEADCVVWDIDDEQTDILLATLNRLCGSDIIDKKLLLLQRLNSRLNVKKLTKLLPQTAKQIEGLTNFKLPAVPVKAEGTFFAEPLVFFVNESQKQIIEDALSKAQIHAEGISKARKRAAALTHIAGYFLGI